MQCLIIAAGQGTRLRPLAESKPLAPVRGAPLIEHVIRLATLGGASEFVVVTGYEAPRVEGLLGELSARLGVSIRPVFNPHWDRPNGWSVAAAAPHLASEFLLLMSDHLFDPAIVRRLVTARNPGATLTLAADYRLDNPLVDMDDVTKIAVTGGGRITRISKALTEFDAFDTGIFLAKPGLFESIERSIEAGVGSLSEGVQRLADAAEAYVSDIGARWWIDVDDPAALALAERTFPDFLIVPQGDESRDPV